MQLILYESRNENANQHDSIHLLYCKINVLDAHMWFLITQLFQEISEDQYFIT